MQVSTRIAAITATALGIALVAHGAVKVWDAGTEARLALDAGARKIARAAAVGAQQEADRRGEVTPSSYTVDDWGVAVVPLSLADAPARQARLDTLREVQAPLTIEQGNERVHLIPVRVVDPTAVDGFKVVGAVEVSHDLAEVQGAWRKRLWQLAPIYFGILLLAVLVTGLFTRQLVTVPLRKLLLGVDDVAQGDLSRVLLSERDDEIGSIAARFNEMTQSLRESRAESARQNEAKMTLEERLSETEKLATIGQLAAEIAHEVGTPLNVIAGRAKTLGRKAENPAAVTKNATIIAEQAGRITRIIQRLLDIARKKVGSIEEVPVSMNDVARSTVDFLESKFGQAHVSTELDADDGLPTVKGNPDKLQQVVINLLMNAVEATPRGGTVSVATSTVIRKRPGLKLAPEARYVVLSISDSGAGVPANDRERIFEPFHTSKEADGGTGLGLAVTAGIVKEHDGWIEVGDGPAGGAQFEVFIPSATEAAA